jgi:hypothetical protein
LSGVDYVSNIRVGSISVSSEKYIVDLLYNVNSSCRIITGSAGPAYDEKGNHIRNYSAHKISIVINSSNGIVESINPEFGEWDFVNC